MLYVIKYHCDALLNPSSSKLDHTEIGTQCCDTYEEAVLFLNSCTAPITTKEELDDLVALESNADMRQKQYDKIQKEIFEEDSENK